jgi:hypothetical protein
MASILRTVIAVIVALAAGDVRASGGPVVLSCTAFGGSHTARMTFDFDPARCRLYWREIEQVLPLETCTAEMLVATKPYSPTVQSRLHFNLATGRFVDQYGDVEDRGSCKAAPAG